MRISDWSSDVCSSDLLAALGHAEDFRQRTVGRIAFQPFDSARTKDQHAMCAFAAHDLLPGEGDDIQLVPGQVHREHGGGRIGDHQALRSEEHTSELQSLMRISYAVFCLKKKTKTNYVNF